MEDKEAVPSPGMSVMVQPSEVPMVVPSGGWEDSVQVGMEEMGSAGDVNLRLEDCMDMVVSYRCKFCCFTAVTPLAIRDHVSKVHILQRPAKVANISLNSSIPETSAASKANPVGNNEEPDMSENLSAEFVSMHATENDHNQDNVSPEMGQTGLAVVTGVMEQGNIEAADHTEDNIAQSRESSFSHDREEQVLIQDCSAFPSNLGLKEESTTLLPSSTMSTSSTQVGFACVEETVVPSGSEIAEALVVEESAEEDIQFEGVESGTGLVANKELFLCGQCNLGFTNIVDCKSHMVQDHNLNMDGVGENTEDEAVLPPNCISVGTQVQGMRKKPGRKKKSEKPAEQASQEEKQIESEEENIFETSSKRKVRPPRALTQLYYLSKTKKTTRDPPKFPRERYKLTCPKIGCHAKFFNQASLDLHIKCHAGSSGEAGGLFQCIHCNQMFPGWKQLRLHLWRQHSVDTDLYKCPTCEFRSDSTHKMSVHLEIHSDERPYACDICGKGFKQLNQMRMHRLIHGDRSVLANPSWYSSRQCEVCKRVFATKKCLQRHVEAVHGEDKPFSCPYCSHVTARKAMMDLHVRTHTGEKPFKCEHCNFATGDHNSLRRHRMRHTGQKPYKCQYCVYSCIQAISLKTHMKNKHPGLEGIFTCNLCQYRTVNDLHFKNHMQDHDSGLITVTPRSTNSGQQTKTGRGRRANSKLVGKIGKQVDCLLGQSPGILGTLDSGQTLEITEQPTAGDALSTGGMNTTDLIYSALNAIRQQTNSGDGELDPTNLNINSGGLQPSVSTSTQDGVTTHTITFHIPPGSQPGESTTSESSPLVLTVQPMTTSAGNTGVLQEGVNQDATMEYSSNVNAQLVDVLQVDELGNIPGAQIVEIIPGGGGEALGQRVVSEADLEESVDMAHIQQAVGVTASQVQQQAVQLLPSMASSEFTHVNISGSRIQEVPQEFQHVISEREPQLHGLQMHPDGSASVDAQMFHTAQVIHTLQTQANEHGESLILQAGDAMTAMDNNQEQNLLILQSNDMDSETVEVPGTESMEAVPR